MQKIVITYGVIAGLVIICSIMASIFLGAAEVWLGFLVMIVAFSAIFIAIKQYRDQALGGVIKFSTAALLGLGIVAIASIVYVIVWEIYIHATDFLFIDQYANAILDDKKAAGVSGAEWDALVKETEQMRLSYRNPLVRVPMTLLEVFPIGLLIALLSAAMLRNSHKTPETR